MLFIGFLSLVNLIVLIPKAVYPVGRSQTIQWGLKLIIFPLLPLPQLHSPEVASVALGRVWILLFFKFIFKDLKKVFFNVY